MKAIYVLSSALLLVFGLLGSASSARTLASTFDEGNEGWGLVGEAAPSWQRFGGDQGDFSRWRAPVPKLGALNRQSLGRETGAGTSEGY